MHIVVSIRQLALFTVPNPSVEHIYIYKKICDIELIKGFVGFCFVFVFLPKLSKYHKKSYCTKIASVGGALLSPGLLDYYLCQTLLCFYLVKRGWLVGWLASWLLGWLVG